MAGTFKKGKSKTRVATEILERIIKQDPDLMRRGWLALFHKASLGDVPAMTLLVNYTDGKPHQSVDMEVEVTGDETQTASNEQLMHDLRNRLAGILPKRTVPSLESGGSDGGGEKKTH